MANIVPPIAEATGCHDFTQLVPACGDPEWALGARRTAWDHFCKTPWPSRTDEGWRRADLAGVPFEEVLATWSAPHEASLRPHGDAQPGGSASSVAEGPGRAGLPEDAVRRGVLLKSLQDAMADHPDLVRPYLDAAPYDPTDQKFVSLTRALWDEGIFLYVPRGVSVGVPLHVQATFGHGRLACPRLLVVVEEDASVILLDEHVSGAFPHTVVASSLADLFVGSGAEVRYVNLNRWGDNVYSFQHIRSEVERDAHLVTLTISLGSRLTKATNEAVLVGEGARSDMLGLTFAKADQHIEYHTVQHHRVANTESDLLFKAAVSGKARSVYSGMIRIDKGAQRANAYQTNQNILLSKDAHADTIPNLEILANDVRCSHGATVAPLDPNQIFYMTTRGIPPAEARRLIVAGFLDQVLDRAELGLLDGYVRARAEEAIAEGYI
ncbi:MAG: Fe-S cluster assembly protein SufD [Fimbriimonadia bacterium]